MLKQYSPDLASSYYYLFRNLKQIVCGKRFSSNEKAISVTKHYFAGFQKIIAEMVRKYCWLIGIKNSLKIIDNKNLISFESSHPFISDLMQKLHFN